MSLSGRRGRCKASLNVLHSQLQSCLGVRCPVTEKCTFVSYTYIHRLVERKLLLYVKRAFWEEFISVLLCAFIKMFFKK